MYPISAKPLHQQVPGGMKANVIQTLSLGIVTQQLRRMRVRQTTQLQ